MKKLIASAMAIALAVALTLASVAILVGATIRISEATNSVLRVVGLLAELVLGALWLLGTVFAATRLAVLIFAEKPVPHS